MDDRPASTAVAIWKRVDRLELGVCDRCLFEDRDVVSGKMGDQVVDRRRHPLVLWRNKVRGVWAVATAPNPDRLGTPVADDVRAHWLHQLPVHLDDGLSVEAICQPDGGSHHGAVGDNLRSVALGCVAQFGSGDGSSGCGEMFDAARRCGLRAKQDGCQWGDLVRHVGVKAGDVGGGLIERSPGSGGEMSVG